MRERILTSPGALQYCERFAILALVAFLSFSAASWSQETDNPDIATQIRHLASRDARVREGAKTELRRAMSLDDAMFLAAAGPDEFPAFVQFLNDQDAVTRAVAAGYLATGGADKTLVIRSLSREFHADCMPTQNPRRPALNGWDAAISCGTITQGLANASLYYPDEISALLIDILGSRAEDPTGRATAAKLLSDMGPVAGAAVPTLVAVVNDSKRRYRRTFSFC